MSEREIPSQLPLVEKYWNRRFEEGWGERKKQSETRVLKFVQDYETEIGPDILDIGSGEGRHILPLAQLGYKVTGAELTETGVKITKNKLAENKAEAQLVRADFHNLPFADESFDTVISVQAMQHNDAAGARESLAETSRVLKPGGLFFLRVRASTADLSDKAEEIPDTAGRTYIIRDGAEENRGPVHLYTREELEELATTNNLDIIEEPDEEQIPADRSTAFVQWNVVFRKKLESAENP